jgi:nucleoside-diphosphate-sugar epimerase
LLNRGTRELPWTDVNIEQVLCDRNDTDGFTASLAGHHFDAVIDMILSNGDQARSAITALKERCSHYLMISTLSAYAPPYISPIHETDPLEQNPENAYGYNKAQAEEALMSAYREQGFPATILRLPAVYGEYDYQIRERYFIKRLFDKRTQMLLPEGGVGLISREYAGNIAGQLCFLIQKPESIGQVYNSGHTKLQTYRALVEDAMSITDQHMTLYSVPAPIFPGVPDLAWPSVIYQSTSKLESLGWVEQFTAKEGLARTIEWLRHEPDEILPTHRCKEKHFDYEQEDAVIAAHGVKISD